MKKKQSEKMAELGGQWDDTAEVLICSQIISKKRIKESFEAYLSTREEIYPEIAYYSKNGSWRNRQQLPESTIESILPVSPDDLEYNQCYYNSQTNIGPQRQYVEGYAILEDGSAAVPHAWFEHEHKVVEVTPSIDQSTTLYFGCEFEDREIDQALIEREQVDPIVESVVG